MISLAADHHAVNVLQVGADLFVGGDAAVDDDFQVGKFLLEAVHIFVFQRRYIAVFFGREAVEPGVAGMNDKGGAGGFVAQRADKISHGLVFGLAVDADAVFDGDGNLDDILHGIETVGHQIDFVHQAGAERAFLHARAGTAAVKIDFVVAVFLAGFGRLCQVGRFAAAQLQGNGLLAVVEHQKAVFIAVDNGTGVNHFAVQPSILGNLARHVAVMAVGPVEHGGNG